MIRAALEQPFFTQSQFRLLPRKQNGPESLNGVSAVGRLVAVVLIRYQRAAIEFPSSAILDGFRWRST